MAGIIKDEIKVEPGNEGFGNLYRRKEGFPYKRNSMSKTIKIKAVLNNPCVGTMKRQASFQYKIQAEEFKKVC